MKKIKGVKVLSGCISCGTCAVVCPKVFRINSAGDGFSHVKEGTNLAEHSDCIKEAAEMCPVQVIKIEWDDSGEREDSVD